MTNKKVIEMYIDFLVKVVGCRADARGNRPCDYWLGYNKCRSDHYQKIWQDTLNKALEKEKIMNKL